MAIEQGLDEIISDFALIGCDPFFWDGAAIGVLLEAKNSATVRKALSKMRMQLARKGGAEHQFVSLDGRTVSFWHAPGNTVRSFYAIDGKYHFVTNSSHLMARFFAAGRGVRSLGKRKDFQYARSKAPLHQSNVVFFYLSDPFFRELISPAVRIEMTRRLRAAAELRQIELATTAAQAEGYVAGTLDELIANGFLPERFGQRCDGSRLVRNGKHWADSLRGRLGVFLPAADVAVKRATPSEARAYRRFTAEYGREWRLVDPVSVAISRRPGKGSSREKVFSPARRERSLSVYWTPG